MLCPKCSEDNHPDEHRCAHCGAGLAVALLEVVRGNVAERLHFLKPREYSVGRARQNDVCLVEPSISKLHARLSYRDGRFDIEDMGSLHGVYVNAAKTQKTDLAPGTLIQLGNITLKYSLLASDSGNTDQMAQFPWVEQQQLLLSLVQTLNSTLVLSQVLEQVLEAVMRITRAERGFLLLADDSPDAAGYPSVAGLRVRVGRTKGDEAVAEPVGISTSVVKRAMEAGETVATGNAVADPQFGGAQSVILMDLRTIVCIPVRSPRAELQGDGGTARMLGALYVDNHETSAPFGADSLRTAEALARHAALAIENAQLFEREQKTIEELRMAQRQLLHADKLATIGQMAAGIAHELNTPLTYIMGNLELLQGQDLAESQHDMLRSVARGAERIKSLAQSLLAFSRPAQEQPVELPPNDTVARTLELCHYQIVKGGVRLETDLAADLPPIRGVSSEIEMALINLVVNAVQAVGPGGHVKVSSALRDSTVVISVSDDGPGIPEHIRANVLEPFFTTKPEGEGTGLGLSTVLMVVERLGGRIDFECPPGGGTTFRISLPVAGSAPGVAS